MSDQLDDHSMDDGLMADVSLFPRMNVMDDHSMDGSHGNRNYAPRDRMMDGNLDVKNLHVKLMDDLSMSCDRMSHDHLRCDRQMMRHRDKNRKVGMNLDAKNLDGMMIHHGNHRMKVCPKTDDRMKI
jgi:hypothetical protein